MSKQAAGASKSVAKAGESTIGWRVSLGWREGGNAEALTCTHVAVQAPAGAVRRASRAGRAAGKPPSKDARFAGVLAVVREDALSLVAA